MMLAILCNCCCYIAIAVAVAAVAHHHFAGPNADVADIGATIVTTVGAVVVVIAIAVTH